MLLKSTDNARGNKTRYMPKKNEQEKKGNPAREQEQVESMSSRLMFHFTIGRRIHHHLLGREQFLDFGQGVGHLHKPHDIDRREINGIILAALLHDLGRAQHHASARLVVFLEDARELGGDFGELWFRAGHGGQAHGHADVEGAEPDDVNVRDGGEDVVEVVDCLAGFDLDHDGGLTVQILVDGDAGVAGRV